MYLIVQDHRELYSSPWWEWMPFIQELIMPVTSHSGSIFGGFYVILGIADKKADIQKYKCQVWKCQDFLFIYFAVLFLLVNYLFFKYCKFCIIFIVYFDVITSEFNCQTVIFESLTYNIPIHFCIDCTVMHGWMKMVIHISCHAFVLDNITTCQIFGQWFLKLVDN